MILVRVEELSEKMLLVALAGISLLLILYATADFEWANEKTRRGGDLNQLHASFPGSWHGPMAAWEAQTCNRLFGAALALAYIIARGPRVTETLLHTLRASHRQVAKPCLLSVAGG